MLAKTRFVLFVGALFMALVLASPVSLAQQASTIPDFREMIDGERVMEHVQMLSVEIGPRLYGTEAEAEAADYIVGQFRSWNYDIEIQPFQTLLSPCDDEEEVVTSQNIIASRLGDESVIIVGAHMDSYGEGDGAGANASGVAAMLAAAEAMADIEIQHTLIFIAFGANEGGCPTGADYYVFDLGDDIENVVAMLNVDAVGIGTQLYAYAGAEVVWGPSIDAPPTNIDGGPIWVRSLIQNSAREMDFSLKTSPAETWAGYTGPWSDHAPFVAKGVPIGYLEAWQWSGSGVDDPWWGVETTGGDVMHSSGDIFRNVNQDNVEMAAEILTLSVYNLAITDDLSAFFIPECTISSRANVTQYSGPGTSFTEADQLTQDKHFSADGQIEDEDGMIWWHLMDDTWVQSDGVDKVGDCSELPKLNF